MNISNRVVRGLAFGAIAVFAFFAAVLIYAIAMTRDIFGINFVAFLFSPIVIGLFCAAFALGIFWKRPTKSEQPIERIRRS